MQLVNEFFQTAEERYRIKLRRDTGQSWPWTENGIFQQYRFTNVFREHDRTTTWLRENVRSRLSEIATDDPFRLRLVEAIVAFRWFNRIETGEIIKDLLLYGWDGKEAYNRLKDVKPVVTGAYMIKTVDGMKKAEGIIYSIEEARKLLPSMVPIWGKTLQQAWADLTQIRYLGPFMAHEIVQDLRWTRILCEASDINAWTHCGPGATRGASWVIFGEKNHFNRQSAKDQEEMKEAMLQLLSLSRDETYWPQTWPEWELHEVEMWLCEFAKYCRAWKENRSLKRRYRE